MNWNLHPSIQYGSENEKITASIQYRSENGARSRFKIEGLDI